MFHAFLVPYLLLGISMVVSVLVIKYYLIRRKDRMIEGKKLVDEHKSVDFDIFMKRMLDKHFTYCLRMYVLCILALFFSHVVGIVVLVFSMNWFTIGPRVLNCLSFLAYRLLPLLNFVLRLCVVIVMSVVRFAYWLVLYLFTELDSLGDTIYPDEHDIKYTGVRNKIRDMHGCRAFFKMVQQIKDFVVALYFPELDVFIAFAHNIVLIDDDTADRISYFFVWTIKLIIALFTQLLYIDEIYIVVHLLCALWFFWKIIIWHVANFPIETFIEQKRN